MAMHMDQLGRRGNPWRMAVWGAAACLLLLPLVAMQFTRDVNWTGSDFALFGTMLLVACGMYELGAWISGNTAYRAGMGLAVAGGFFLVWVHMAVGVLGNDTNRENLMFAGVLAVGIIGALVARFRPAGMARAAGATAIAQALACIVAVLLFAADHEKGPIAILSAILVLAWSVSAVLFRLAARQETARAQ